MNSITYTFVLGRAWELGFFDIDRSRNLTSHLLDSQRACVLKSTKRFPSSSNLWLHYINSGKRLESLTKIRTFLYVNELIVDIRMEWFSKMRNLVVLHLVNLISDDDIGIVDFKFLEELTNMRQLRLLSLEGCTTLKKLPNSVCKIANLRMLNLRYCANLEELPAGIGSLENITHLDLTQCHFLSELPRGLRFLSKLEVLKGFAITYGFDGRKDSKACILRDLLKLENLRKLNLIVVNKKSFPNSKDLQVFRDMKNLYNLKITWKTNYYENEEPNDGNEQEGLRHSRWQHLKCWKQQTSPSDIEEPSIRDRLDNLKKLVLCCFPHETAPSWLNQGELQNLRRLYIVGGNLKTVPGDRNQNVWNSVKSVKFKYLSNLKALRQDLRDSFCNVVMCCEHCPLVDEWFL